jgi:hypothetical protein
VGLIERLRGASRRRTRVRRTPADRISGGGLSRGDPPARGSCRWPDGAAAPFAGATSACPYPLVVWRHSPRVRPYQMPARIRARSRLSRSSISRLGAGSLGLVIGWRAKMDARGGRLVAPRADQQYTAHHRPAGRGVPGRIEHHRAGPIAPVRRHADIRGSQPEPPALPVEDVAKMLGPSIRGKHTHSTLPLGATSAHTSQSEMTCSPRSAETDSCPPSNATGQTLRTSDQAMDSIVGADTAQ